MIKYLKVNQTDVRQVLFLSPFQKNSDHLREGNIKRNRERNTVEQT